MTQCHEDESEAAVLAALGLLKLGRGPMFTFPLTEEAQDESAPLHVQTHTIYSTHTCTVTGLRCIKQPVQRITAEIKAISVGLHVSLTNTSPRFGQVLKPVLDYIPESNLAEIKLFPHESKEGKRIKTRVYRKATYGKTRTDVV